MMDCDFLKAKSEEIRKKVIQYHSQTKTGHIGSDLSSVEIMTSLHYNILHEEDRFILSKGHASGILYVILNDMGKIPDEQLNHLEEHPTINKKYGICATTGSLGQGLSLGLGMALANPKSKIYILMGDGECDEGQVWEAARTASDFKINNLITIVDCNGFQGFKDTNHFNLDKRFESFGWEVRRCEGHNLSELSKTITAHSKSPLVVLANTIKGKGLPHLENQLKSHYAYQ